MSNNKGLISSMQHFSTGDGPGIRTTVFFQGCPLHCAWCHNPETIPGRPVLLFYPQSCTGCGLCERHCPSGAHRMTEAGHVFERGRCQVCGECVKYCAAGALQQSGQHLALETVMDYILQDTAFYRESGGGVTLSGGEPLLQSGFAAQIARACHESGVHVIVDTAGCVPFAAFEAVLPYTDCFYFDLKAANGEDFRRWTGGDFTLVQNNLHELCARGCEVVVRVPVIPGYNDAPAYAAAMAQLVCQLGAGRVELVPFHRLGSAKYAALGLDYALGQQAPLSRQSLLAVEQVYQEHGLLCRIDG